MTVAHEISAARKPIGKRQINFKTFEKISRHSSIDLTCLFLYRIPININIKVHLDPFIRLKVIYIKLQQNVIISLP